MPHRRPTRGLAALSIAGVRITRRGQLFLLASLIALVAAYSSGLDALLYVSALLAALPVIAIVIVRLRRPRLAVTRVFAPHVIPAGSSAMVSLVVRNLAPGRSMRARWWDTLPWHPGETEEAELPSLAARGLRFARRGNTVAMGYDLTPPRRGIFPVGPLGVEVEDPFRLATSSLVIGDQQPIVVIPEVVHLSEVGLSMPAGDGESRLVQRRATGDDDDSMTREYRAGDAMRRVHWRASARHGDLMVRQEEQRSFPEVRIVIDTRRAGYRDVSTDGNETESAAFEWVVRMLASAAVHLRRVGFLVTIDETGEPQLEHVGRGRRRTWGDEEFLTSLAALELTDTVAASRTGAGGEHGRGASGPIIAIVGTPEPETFDWLVRQRRQGELAVAFMVRDATALDVFDRSFGIPATTSVMAERLEHAGWLVVPVHSGDDHAVVWEAVVLETDRARGSA